MRRSSHRATMFMSNFLSFLLQVLLFFLLLKRCTSQVINNCLEEGSSIIDDASSNTTNLSSPKNIFVLGFFTPDGSANKHRYLGIWYSNYTNMKTVVWVANRDNPLLEPNASLTIRDGNARLLDRYGSTYWSSDAAPKYNSSLTSLNLVVHINFSPLSNSTRGGKIKPLNLTKLCLANSGNLFLTLRDPLKPVWQSFDHPTDTLLPGMFPHSDVNSLISWQNQSTPASGNFTLHQLNNDLNVLKAGSTYWSNRITPSNQIPAELTKFLQGGKNVRSLMRLVIAFTGQIQLWEWDNSGMWSLTWFEPKDRCDLDGVCGNFASCNSYNELSCKCLPGFKPTNPGNWIARNFSDGCSPKSQTCGRNYTTDDIFLTLPKMEVESRILANGLQSSPSEDCRKTCLSDCHCVAYSNVSSKCTIWSTDLTGLQEEYPGGSTLYLRTTHSDIARTSRDCGPCGTYSIPYPLSTSATCGDPSYFYFHCNASTDQVVFSTSNGTFNVTSINEDNQTFLIQVAHSISCDIRTMESIVLSNMQFSPFNVRNCTSVSLQPLTKINQPFSEVEIGWQLPPEPTCKTSSDCLDWPHTTCKTAKDGKMRCMCASNFKWVSLDLKCEKVFPDKVLVACIVAALAIVLLGGIIFIYWKRRIARETGSVEFTGDVGEQIDLPFFDWETILSATNNFSDENKLGTGGFGSVYKGILSDGQEIAVKRLSNASVQGIEEFRTEVVLIAKLQHRNLVRLLGYCVKADEKILVYEYMPNGSLDSCLFDQALSVNLDWEKRFDIISGIARGLLYLHQDSRLRIIHRDLKPSNILLDDDLNPKISDFGIARIVEGKQTESSTIRVVGTYGYMSPEYAHEGIFSVKSDVFSFGVVVLETISGRRNSRIFIYEHGLSLLGHAWKLWSEDRGMELADQALKESCNISEVLKCIQIALLCIQEDPSDRPTMSGVFLMLSTDNTSLPPPKQPAFSTRKPHLETASSSSAVNSSINDLTLTVSTTGR